MNRKRILHIALVVFGVLILWRFTEAVFLGRMEALNREISSASRTLGEIREMKEAFGHEAPGLPAGGFPADRQRDYTPLSFLERLSQSSGADYELIYREPRPVRAGDDFLETSVRVELRGIDAPGLVEYLYAVENSGEFLRLRNLNVRPHQGALRASFDVATLIPR